MDNNPPFDLAALPSLVLLSILELGQLTVADVLRLRLVNRGLRDRTFELLQLITSPRHLRPHICFHCIAHHPQPLDMLAWASHRHFVLDLDLHSVAQHTVLSQLQPQTRATLAVLVLRAKPQHLSLLTGIREIDCSRLELNDKDLVHLSTSHALNLSDQRRLRHVGSLAEVPELNLASSTNIVDLDALHRVRDLNLHGHFELSLAVFRDFSALQTLDLSNCHGLTDVSALAAIPHLNLAGCWNLTDVSPLGRAVSLDLSHCRKLSDVSALGNVQTLKLRDCLLLSDVSALRNVKNLDLSRCRSIDDVSSLGNCHTLNLSGCEGVTDVSALICCKVLDFSDCRRIVDVTGLIAARSLNLQGCYNLVHVNHLGYCEDLDLSRCYLVEDISGLSRVRRLKLDGCYKVTNFSCLGAQQELNLSGCTALQDCSHLGGVEMLDLSGTSVVDVSALGRVTTLDLSRTPVMDVSALGAVKSLTLDNTAVRDISALGSVESLSLQNCPHIENFEALARIPFLRLGSTMDVHPFGKPSIQTRALCTTDSFQAVKSLKITRNRWLWSVGAMSSVRHLDLTDCGGLDDVSGLVADNLHHLSLAHCRLLRNVAALASLPALQTLDLRGCAALLDSTDWQANGLAAVLKKVPTVLLDLTNVHASRMEEFDAEEEEWKPLSLDPSRTFTLHCKFCSAVLTQALTVCEYFDTYEYAILEEGMAALLRQCLYYNNHPERPNQPLLGEGIVTFPSRNALVRTADPDSYCCGPDGSHVPNLQCSACQAFIGETVTECYVDCHMHFFASSCVSVVGLDIRHLAGGNRTWQWSVPVAKGGNPWDFELKAGVLFANGDRRR